MARKKKGTTGAATQLETIEISKKEESLGLEASDVKLASREKLQMGLAWGMLVLFGITICATISMIILNGLHITQISNDIVIALVGATIAETGGMLILIIQSVFGERNTRQE
ncbi:MAG: hypothetical protein V3V45_00420 [Candidatus Brocadiales bacterium]